MFKNCRIARMSSGRYCLIRDLGLVKGGKGLRHHEVLVAFTLRDLSKRLRRIDLASGVAMLRAVSWRVKSSFNNLH
jgi:hypothetical protein